MSKWKTIDSAPRDGTLLLLAKANWPTGPVRKCGGWDAEANCWYIFGATWEPTHYQIFPEFNEKS